MSNIDSGPYFMEIQDEVFGAVDAILENTHENNPASYLATIEDDLSEIKEVYGLSPEELEGVGEWVANRLGVKSVLSETEDGIFFIQFYIEPKNARGD